MNLPPFVVLKVLASEEVAEFLRQFFESNSDAGLARVDIDVVAGLDVSAYDLVVLLKSILAKPLKQLEVIVLEESMGNNRESLMLSESGHLQEGIQEQLLPDMVDRGLNRGSGHGAVPPFQFGEEHLSARVRPYLLEESQPRQELWEHLAQKPIVKVELHVHHVLEAELFFLLYLGSDELIDSEGPARDYLVDAGTVFVVVGGEFVVPQSEIPLLGVQHHCLLLNCQTWTHVVLIRVAVLNESTHLRNLP